MAILFLIYFGIGLYKAILWAYQETGMVINRDPLVFIGNILFWPIDPFLN